MHRGHRLRAFSSDVHSKWARDQDTSWGQEGRAIPDSGEQLITGFSLCGTPITEFLTQMDAEKKKKIITVFYFCVFHVDRNLKSHHGNDVISAFIQSEASTGKDHSIFYYYNYL